jgi:myo-inositol 2-dehydrogenase / D-chiro-inositol 1-dehydrogenase
MKRRQFITKTISSAAGAFLIPTIVPSHVLGKDAPSNKINIAQIGMGRFGRSDARSMMSMDDARVIACCDLDRKRLEDGKAYIEDLYSQQTGKSGYVDVRMYDDYRELLLNPDIDAVGIATPDHWHAQPAIEAALAGKDVFLQKPTTLTIAEGRLLSNTVTRQGTVLQVCTQHRCSSQFRIAAELVRNARIGTLHSVYIGIGGESPGPEAQEMPVPKTFNYDMWLGSTPWVYYTEIGVHPQNDYGRPGWMKRHQFGAGGITNTGQHYIDVSVWGMNVERTGPVSIQAVGEFPRSGIFDVPKDFMVIAEYANGLRCLMSNRYTSGVRYEGTEGWISARPGGGLRIPQGETLPADSDSNLIEASDRKILSSRIRENEIHLLQTSSLHRNWLDCVKTREQPLIPAEVGHRSCSLALLGDIAMHTGRKLKWDPARERFIGDDEANLYVSRPQRKPYGTNYIKI